MLELNKDDFYRAWVLVEGYIRIMSESNNYSQKAKNEDEILGSKLKLCWQLGLKATFQTTQL